MSINIDVATLTNICSNFENITNIKLNSQVCQCVTHKNTIELQPHTIHFNAFKNLFYNNGDTFQINPQKYNVPELYLENQTILDVDGVQPFILFDEVTGMYSEFYGTQTKDFKTSEIIKLRTELNKFISLSDFCASLHSINLLDLIESVKNSGANEHTIINFYIYAQYFNPKWHYEPIIIKFHYIITNFFNSPNLKNVTYIDNSHFKTGTLRIRKPGTYVFSENIIFEPNADADLKPKPEQYELYPPLQGYVLGFFAAITIECDDVILDLAGHSLSQSLPFAVKQRFGALIELANTPFIPKQGPAKFGTFINSAQNIIIKNGTLGKSSHHGIHGNNVKNVLIENIVFSDFEVSAISLNAGIDITVQNCLVNRVSQNIKMNSKYSQSKFSLPIIKSIVDMYPNAFLKTPTETKTAVEIYNNLKKEIKDLELSIISGHNFYNGIFNNPSGKYDGNVYGMTFNSKGVLVNDFKTTRSETTQGNENITLKNIVIKNIISDGTEVLAIGDKNNSTITGYGKNVIVGFAGDVVDIMNCVDDNGVYVSTVLSDAQFLIGKYGQGETKGTCNIPQILINWVENGGNIYSFVLKEYSESFLFFVDGVDSMAHVMKGNIGLFIQQGKNVHIENILIDKVENYGSTQNGISSQSLGVAVVGSLDVTMKNVNVGRIFSKNSYAKSIENINSEITQI
jgi:hypothetical protein